MRSLHEGEDAASPLERVVGSARAGRGLASMIGWLVLAAFSAGLVDAIAGGGGLVTVPTLLAAGLPPHVALATNKAQSVWGSSAALLAFGRRGLVDRRRALPTLAAAFAGALLGAKLVLLLPQAKLRGVMLVLLVAAAGLAFVKKPSSASGTRLARARPTVAALLVALPIGFYDGFFGPGTGTFFLLAYAHVWGDDLLAASGNAKAGNFASNLAAFCLFAASGAVRWELAWPMALAAGLGAAVGARLAHRLGAGLVRVAATAVCLLLAARTFASML